MLAKELELREADKFAADDGLQLPENPLPLANLDKNIVCADSLFTDWPKADAIIGNPPYLGSRYLAKEHGYDYANKLYARFPDVPKMADFCTHWFRLAHDALPLCTAQNPCSGRAGLVGTNTIRQNESREASLDYIVENGGVITEAISTQVWSGDAAVHVSIVNWEKTAVAETVRATRAPGSTGVPPVVSGGPPETSDVENAPISSSSGSDAPATSGGFGGSPKPTGGPPVLPRICRLTFQRGDSVDSPWETYELPVINPALSVGTDVTGAQVLAANAKPKVVFQGQKPNHEGFFLTPDEAANWIRKDARYRDVLFPYMIGRDLVDVGAPSRWVIDFAKRDVFGARDYELAFDRVRTTVMPDIVAKAEKERADTGRENGVWSRMAEQWWHYERQRHECIAAINLLPRYMAISRVTKRPIFDFLSSAIHPDTALIVFAFADDYSFGILQSSLHWEWFKARCSTLKADFRYTSDTVFDTFPWPQTPTKGQIAEVAAASVALRALRREIMARLGYSLRALYRTLDSPGANPLREAHTRLDTAVRAAYAMPKAADPLAFLLALNLTLAAKEKSGEPITSPGLPLPEAERAPFVTDDCVRVTKPE